MPVRIRAKKSYVIRKDYDGTRPTISSTYTKEDGWRLVPCGKCTQCRNRRANDWIIRMLEEERAYNGGIFVTLTYAPETVPITPKGYMTLDKSDVQKFLKRLRKETGKKIKYYAAGEYGDHYMRPHYHLIMYGCTKEDVAYNWKDVKTGKPMGDVHVGDVTGASIRYSLKYICKDKKVPQHVNDDRLREFSLMSKNLGLTHLSPQMVDYYRRRKESTFIKEDGLAAALPRYYREKLFSPLERELISEQSQEKHYEQHDKMIEYYGGITEYYRMQGEFARNDKIKQGLVNRKEDIL